MGGDAGAFEGYPGALRVLPRTRVSDHKGCGRPDELGGPLSESADDVPAHPDGVPALGGVDYRCQVGAVVRGVGWAFDKTRPLGVGCQGSPGADDLCGCLVRCHSVGVDGPMGEGVARLTVGLERSNPGGRVFGLEHRPDYGAALPALLLQATVNRLRPRLDAYNEAALLHGAAVLFVHRQPAAS